MIGILANLVGLVLPSPVAAAQAAVHPNPYAAYLQNQSQIAVDQTISAGLQPPFGTGAESSGDEEDWFQEQAYGNPNGIGDNYVADQRVSNHRIPPSSQYPRLPASTDTGVGSGVGRGTGYKNLAYNKGWVVLPNTGWGGAAGPFGHDGQHTIAPSQTMVGSLAPTDRSPLPQEMADAFAKLRAGKTRLQDILGGGGS